MNLVPGQVDGGLDTCRTSLGVLAPPRTRERLEVADDVAYPSAPWRASVSASISLLDSLAPHGRTHLAELADDEVEIGAEYARGLLISCATPAASVPTDAMRSDTSNRASSCLRLGHVAPHQGDAAHAPAASRIGEATRARFSARPSLRTPTVSPVRRLASPHALEDVAHQVPLPGGEQDRGGLVTDLPGRPFRRSRPRERPALTAPSARGRRTASPDESTMAPGAGAHPRRARAASSSLPMLLHESRARSGTPRRETCRRSAA